MNNVCNLIANNTSQWECQGPLTWIEAWHDAIRNFSNHPEESQASQRDDQIFGLIAHMLDVHNEYGYLCTQHRTSCGFHVS